ncbi:MAG: response regulator transcription factor [Methyloversatilis sp.]|nr:response regulator transcription factor [Methyloversatilis sp.]MBP6193167.1 response regulator transcription factor [Methyloversatilis sp.]
MTGNDLVCVVDDDDGARGVIAEALRPLGLEVQVFVGAGALLQRTEVAARAACLVLSASLRGTSGLELQADLNMIGNRASVLFVSGPCEVSTAVQALRSGALDFMLKPLDPSLLRARVSEAVAIHRARQLRRNRLHHLAQCLGTLTPRERSVLERVMDGCANAAIAADLGISIKTVEQHRARVMDKMKADSLAELVARVTELRLLSGPASVAWSRIAGG